MAKTLRFVQLEGFEGRPATKLSGGQQQRVALARALVAEPKVILFDEPLSNLDAKLREETRKELRAFLGKLQITAVYVTHDRVEALALSDSIAVMRAGKIIEIGTPQKIYFDADHRFVADFIGRANLVKARVRAEEGGLTMVDCGLGTIACQRRDVAVGSEATLCIRPEFIRRRRRRGEGRPERRQRAHRIAGVRGRSLRGGDPRGRRAAARQDRSGCEARRRRRRQLHAGSRALPAGRGLTRGRP